jgi:hypothetical protein
MNAADNSRTSCCEITPSSLTRTIPGVPAIQALRHLHQSTIAIQTLPTRGIESAPAQLRLPVCVIDAIQG